MKKQRFIATASALVLAAVFSTAAQAQAQSASTSASDPLVQQGAYIAKLGDCIACHTATGGKPFAGGLPIASPIGTIYSSNITPDKDTGIGNYTLEDFDRAVRQGVAKDGHHLYPAMPFPSYARVKPEDIKALYAYFMQGVQPVNQANKPTDIPWPLSMRWPLGIWASMFAPKPVTDSAPAGSGDAEVLRGQYLVEGLAHCSACHTPRGFAFQEVATTNAEGTDFLSGGVVDNYLANNLRGDKKDGLGTWSKQDIVEFLKGGRNAHAAAFGGMTEVVNDSTQYMSDADLNAIAAYLKTLPAHDKNDQALAYNDSTHVALRNGTDKSPGAIDFLNNCAACHRSTGKGYDYTFPELAQNPVVNSSDPSSLIHIVLSGAEMPWTTSAPTHYAMPAFADRLTDAEVADVLTFVRSSWGNQAPAVTADQVAKVRKDIHADAAPKR